MGPMSRVLIFIKEMRPAFSYLLCRFKEEIKRVQVEIVKFVIIIFKYFNFLWAALSALRIKQVLYKVYFLRKVT